MTTNGTQSKVVSMIILLPPPPPERGYTLCSYVTLTLLYQAGQLRYSTSLLCIRY